MQASNKIAVAGSLERNRSSAQGLRTELLHTNESGSPPVCWHHAASKTGKFGHDRQGKGKRKERRKGPLNLARHPTAATGSRPVVRGDDVAYRTAPIPKCGKILCQAEKVWGEL
jgi:hypothetical protein